MSLRAPPLLAVIEKAINTRAKDTHCALPARVESYDATKQKVSVLPLVKGWRRDSERVRHFVQLPVITGVPVVFPGAGGYRLTFPIQTGDTVLLVFADYCIDAWLKNGGVVEPLDERTHNLTDAVAIPGLRDFGHPLSSAPTDGASIGRDDGPTIHFYESEIHLGGPSASDAVAMAQKVMDELNALRSAFNGHTHVYTPPMVGYTATPVASAGPNSSVAEISNVGSNIVKVK